MWRRVLILAVVAAFAFVIFRLIDPVGGKAKRASAPAKTSTATAAGGGSGIVASGSSLGPGASPATSPEAPPATGPVTFDSVSFINAEVGWVVGGAGRSATGLLVSRTTDGGRTWSAAVPVAGAKRPPDPSEVAVHFADTAQGWISGLGLWSTSDGGATWHSSGLTGWVGPVAASGRSAWALEYPCGISEQCTPVLVTSALPAQTWSRAAVQPPLPAGPATLIRAGTGVAFITASKPVSGSGAAPDAYHAPGNVQLARFARPAPSNPPLTSPPPTAPSPTAGRTSPAAGPGADVPAAGTTVVVLKTADGGATWATSPSPCPSTLGEATPASLDGTTVWMVCASVSHDEDQDKAVYVSSDGGGTWALQSSTGGAAPPPVGSLTSAGAVLGFTLSGPSTGFMVSSGYGLLRSADRGRTWSLTSVSAKKVPTGNDVLMATFPGASTGWATTCCGGGVPFGSPGLFATTDGGATWSAVATSP